MTANRILVALKATVNRIVNSISLQDFGSSESFGGQHRQLTGSVESFRF